MLTCPLCKKEVALPARTCPRCQADLSLLSDLMADVQKLLAQAEGHRKAGELAAAVRAYLEVLDVDPTNADARAALGPVLLAVQSAHRVGNMRPEPLPVMHMAATLALAAGAVVLGYLVVRAII
jgi:TPR repeat